MLEEDWRRASKLNPSLDYAEFARLYQRRLADSRKYRIPRLLDAGFDSATTPEEKEIKDLIDRFRTAQATEWETELFKQTRRKNDAERTLASKATKKAENDLRVATNKIETIKEWLSGLRSTELTARDKRIYPLNYAPVIVMEDGKLTLKPMRYHCRQNGKPASDDRKYPGLYNARRDNLERYWKRLFGKQHGIVVATSFYENVALHDYEKRELRDGEEASNVVLRFQPDRREPMFVACLWDRWEAPGEEDLLSFTAITDGPPAEVAETGHDRCIIPLKRENVETWLSPSGDLSQSYALLDDRWRPYYEHRLAA